MPRSLLSTLVLGAVTFPIVLASGSTLVGGPWTHAPVHSYDARPPFDGRLPSAATPVATTPVRWARRWGEPEIRAPSDASRDSPTTRWPRDVERRFLDHRESLPKLLTRPRLEPDLLVGECWLDATEAFRTVLPGGHEVYAVVLPRPVFHTSELVLLVRDGATGHLSDELTVLGHHWSEAGFDGPPAWWSDLDGDGHVELGLRRTYRSGDADQGHYVRWFRVSPHLRLEQVHVAPLVDEARTASRGSLGVVRTRLLRDAEGRLVHEQWFENPAYAVAPRNLGPRPGPAPLHWRFGD